MIPEPHPIDDTPLDIGSGSASRDPESTPTVEVTPAAHEWPKRIGIGIALAAALGVARGGVAVKNAVRGPRSGIEVNAATLKTVQVHGRSYNNGSPITYLAPEEVEVTLVNTTGVPQKDIDIQFDGGHPEIVSAPQGTGYLGRDRVYIGTLPGNSSVKVVVNLKPFDEDHDVGGAVRLHENGRNVQATPNSELSFWG
jgi:hypothetical protein